MHQSPWRPTYNELISRRSVASLSLVYGASFFKNAEPAFVLQLQQTHYNFSCTAMHPWRHLHQFENPSLDGTNGHCRTNLSTLYASAIPFWTYKLSCLHYANSINIQAFKSYGKWLASSRSGVFSSAKYRGQKMGNDSRIFIQTRP
jgi:hypothetical protein